jgi:hypothetical protein
MSLIDCYVDSSGCVVCPDIAPTPPVPGGIVYLPILGWNAGANSVGELDGDVELITNMTASVFGAVVGFRHGRAGIGIPDLVTHGFVFEHGIDGLNFFGIVENGVTIMSGMARQADLNDLFWIVRANGVVSYYANSSVPFSTPLYTSLLPSVGPLIIGGCLYASGDDIGDPTLFIPLAPEDLFIEGSVDATGELMSLIATDITGPICFTWLERFYTAAIGSAVYISGNLPELGSFMTDIAGAFIISDAPVIESFFSQYELPPVYLLNSQFSFELTASGYSETTGEMDFTLPELKLIATDVSGALLFSDLEELHSDRTGDIPELHNYFTLLQSPGYLDIVQDVQSPWAIIQENLLGSAGLIGNIGVSVVANAMATDGQLALAKFHKLASAEALVTAQLNQAWFGLLNANVVGNLSLSNQVLAFASLYARCMATAEPNALAKMTAAITVSVIALAGAQGKQVFPLSASAIASIDVDRVYVAVGNLLADVIASVGASRSLAVLAAVDASALAAASAGGTTASFVELMANANAYVRLTYEGDDFEGWVLNATPAGEAKVRAFSTYDNFPFSSFATFNGKGYGAGPDGVFLLEGDTDNGDKIPAWVRTGLLDFDSRRAKRMESIYVGYTSDKRLVAKVVTTNEGIKVENWYTMRERQIASDSREGRIEVGKGLTSVYWAFELHNEDGADFALDVVALWPVFLDRRLT